MFDFLLVISVSVDVSYIISEILDVRGGNDLQILFKFIKSGTNRKLVYDFLLVVYINFCSVTHRSWEIWCETVKWPWNIAKVIDIRITWKQTFDFLLVISVSVDVSYNFWHIALGKVKWPTNIIQGHQSGTNQKLLYDFLLVVDSNFCRITHRFWEI